MRLRNAELVADNPISTAHWFPEDGSRFSSARRGVWRCVARRNRKITPGKRRTRALENHARRRSRHGMNSAVHSDFIPVAEARAGSGTAWQLGKRGEGHRSSYRTFCQASTA